MRKFPKILFLGGEPISMSSATGITTSNLFCEWPKDSLAQIFTANLSTDESKCMFSFRLSSRDLVPFAFMFAGSTGAYISPSNSSAVLLDPRAVGVRAKIQYAVAPLLDFLPYRVPVPVLRQIDDFRPDVIYSLLGNVRITRLALELGRRFRVPVVPHFMDDWLATYSVPDKSTGTWLHRKVLNRAVNRLFQHVPLGMAIGDMMAREYSQKFGCEFLSFMNPVESVKDERDSVPCSASPLVFVYVGGLHLRRDQVLADVAEVLSCINLNGVVAELHIYAPDADGDKARQLAARCDAVRYCGSVPAHEVASVLRHCDVAVHVESSQASVARYTRISMSTKIPQYFASGLPVLAFGPPASASSSYVADTNAGVSVNGLDKAALLSVMERLVSDREWREEMGLSAIKVAMERHLGVRVRSDFADALLRAANAGGQSYA